MRPVENKGCKSNKRESKKKKKYCKRRIAKIGRKLQRQVKAQDRPKEKENNCIAQEEVKAKGDGAKKKWHKRQLSGTSTHNAAGSCGALRLVRELCGKFGVLQNVLIRNRITRHAAI